MIAAEISNHPMQLAVASWAQAIRPRPRVSPFEWCQVKFVLPIESSSSPGPYRPDRAPYVRGVLEAAADPNTQTIVLQWATQTTKTTMLILIALWIAESRPTSVMLATPDRNSLRKLRDKIRDHCNASPALYEIAPADNEWNDRTIEFSTCRFHLGYAGSTQTLSGESCQVVLCSEVDRWRDHAKQGVSYAKALERSKGFFRYLHILESSPTDETSAICELYDETDQRKYNVPCPHCGHHQELRFFPHRDGEYAGRGGLMGIRNDDGTWKTADEVRHTAWYCCEAEGCRIDESDRIAMIARGVWCPEGQTVGLDGKLHGEPAKPPRRAGFQLSSMYAEAISFGRIAEEYLNRRDSPELLQVFWNDWLGLKWSNTRKVAKWKTVGRRLAGNHRRGQVPSQAIFLTCGVDTQDDHLYWVVRAWGVGGTSWLVDWGKINQDVNEQGQCIQNSDLDKWERDVWLRLWPCPQKSITGHTSFKIYMAAIDYQGHRSFEIFDWHKRHETKYLPRLLRLIAGESTIPAGTFFRLSVLEQSQKGKKYAGGLKRWALDVDTYKDDLVNRFGAALDQPGAWFLDSSPITDPAKEDYLRQLCNEAKRPKKTSGRRPKLEYVIIDSRIGNHYWDTEVYARAAADMVVNLDWESLERALAAPSQDTAAEPPSDRERSGYVRRMNRRGGGGIRRS